MGTVGRSHCVVGSLGGEESTRGCVGQGVGVARSCGKTTCADARAGRGVDDGARGIEGPRSLDLEEKMAKWDLPSKLGPSEVRSELKGFWGDTAACNPGRVS